MSKKNIEGGYGYFMSNKIAKDITKSVLKSSMHKDNKGLPTDGDYQEQVHKNTGSGRAAMSQGHKSIFKQ